jgi:hypothetical protein
MSRPDWYLPPTASPPAREAAASSPPFLTRGERGHVQAALDAGCMLTPRMELTVIDRTTGLTELLRPGVSRLNPEHDMVRDAGVENFREAAPLGRSRAQACPARVLGPTGKTVRPSDPTDPREATR